MTRLQSSLRNMTYAVIGQTIGLTIGFLARGVFIRCLSAEYLGIGGVFSGILSMLSLTELGVGTAVTYSLYRPLAEKDTEQLKSLMALFRKAYIIIGCVVAAAGLALIPFLELVIAEMPQIPHLKWIYGLFVFDSAVSYFFTYKRTLMIADQKRYIATCYRWATYFVLNVMQIIVLLAVRSYVFYLLLQLGSTVLENLLLSIKANRLYPFLKEKNIAALRKETAKAVFANVRAMLLHKIGGVIVLGTDNLLLSKLVGVAAVGLYSNYLLITQALNLLLGLPTQAVAAGIGNLGTEDSPAHSQFIFEVLDFSLFWLYAVSSVCLFYLLNPFIALWLGESFLFDSVFVCVLVFHFYISGMRKSVLTFRDALGLYRFDRYKPIVEAVINLVASIVLGIKLGAVGILIGTAISTMTTCFWVEPSVLYKHGFHQRVRAYFIRYARYSLAAVAAGIATGVPISAVSGGGLSAWMQMAAACAMIPNVLFVILFWRTKEFQYLWSFAAKAVTRRFSTSTRGFSGDRIRMQGNEVKK